jgi:hypothetical protein
LQSNAGYSPVVIVPSRWSAAPGRRYSHAVGNDRSFGKRGQMQPTRIGNFEIARIADYEGPFFAPGEFFPDFDPAVIEEHAALLGPRLIDLQFSQLRGQNRPSHDPDRFLHRQ